MDYIRVFEGWKGTCIVPLYKGKGDGNILSNCKVSGKGYIKIFMERAVIKQKVGTWDSARIFEVKRRDHGKMPHKNI